MAQDGEKYLTEPEDFEEINSDFEVEDDAVDNQIEHILNMSRDEILAILDPDDVEGFDYCEFNEKSLNALALRIASRVPRFMKKGKIEKIEDLSIANPKHSVKIKFGKREFSWLGTLDAIVRDAFPEFSYHKFGINRVDMFNSIIKHLIIPVMESESPKNPTINTYKLENAFNETLLYRMYIKQMKNREF